MKMGQSMQLIRMLLIAFTAAVLCASFVTIAENIKLQSDGTYTNVRVGIGDDVSEDWTIVEKIKDGFRAASSQLSVATKRHSPDGLQFGGVEILIPRAWDVNKADEIATWQNKEANFKINNGSYSGTHNDTHAFTIQLKGCGNPGESVYLNANHLISSIPQLLGMEIVREFSKLRWGLFNEFSNDEGPHYYFANGNFTPTACTHGISGRFAHNITGAKCKVSENNIIQLEPNCRFYPDHRQYFTNASILFGSFLDGINQFCSSGAHNRNHSHDVNAPHPHNQNCVGKSAWEVMLGHNDFQTPLISRDARSEVKFTVLRPISDRRCVILLDCSGSMKGEPMCKMQAGTKNFVLKQLEDYIYCGMISFNAGVQILHNLTQFDSESVRLSFKKSIDELVANGATAIGDGLVEGMKMLGADINNLSKNDTGYILLITDGVHNFGNYSFDEAIRLVKKTSIVVDTIHFGEKGDKRLYNLSIDTGGIPIFATFNTSSNDLMESMGKLVRDRVSDEQKPVELYSAPVTYGFNETFYIDKTVAKSPWVILSSTQKSDLNNTDLVLTSPSKKVYDKNSKDVYTKDPGYISITLSGNAEVGNWTITDLNSAPKRLRRSPGQPVSKRMSLTISSKAAQPAPTILDGFISDALVRLDARTQIVVYATLARGSEFFRGASITASIESDNRIEAVIQLQDNGIGGDTLANDGVYSGLVPASVQTVQEYNVRLLCKDPVNRVATAGKFRIVSVDAQSLQNTPPSRIADLRSESNIRNQTVQLTWSAVGDKMMDGMASQYKIRICKSVNNNGISNNSNCTMHNATAQPKPAGEVMQELLTVEQIAEPEDTMQISMFAENEAGIRSERSNTVTAQLSPPKNIDDFDHSFTTPEPTEDATTTEILTEDPSTMEMQTTDGLLTTPAPEVTVSLLGLILKYAMYIAIGLFAVAILFLSYNGIKYIFRNKVE